MKNKVFIHYEISKEFDAKLLLSAVPVQKPRGIFRKYYGLKNKNVT